MYRTENFNLSQAIAQNITIPEYTAYSVTGKGFFSRAWANYNTAYGGFEIRMKIIVDGIQINDSDVTFHESMRFLTHNVVSVTSYNNAYALRIPFNESLVVKIYTTPTNAGAITIGCSGQIMVEV